MAYITYSEYANLTGDSGTTSAAFEQMRPLAEAVVDAHTLYGYIGRELSELPAYIVGKLREAVAYQLQYIAQLGGISGANDADGDFGSVGLGKFNYSLNSSGRASDSGSGNTNSIPLSKAAAVNIPLLLAYVNTMRKNE